MTQQSLRVALGERSYDILIGQGLLARTGELVKPLLASSRAIIVTDHHVASLHLTLLEESLATQGIATSHVILPAGEQTKSFTYLQQLLETILSFVPDRKTTLIAIGGGVIGDITGFAASILLRGVDFIQIPTTLLAQVDSSVGGKTGINTPAGKNLVGAFYQPRLVLADIDMLASLPKRELLAGYAEVVKYGVIHDEPFFDWLEGYGEKALAGDAKALATIVSKSCAAKADIVRQDERESGVRALLNFGHTLGHALEAEMGYSDQLLHGEAVAIGMVLAMQLSAQLGQCSHESVTRLETHLASVGLKTSPRELGVTLNAEALIAHCAQDKKAIGGKLTFILAKNIGKTYVSHDVTEGDLKRLLAQVL